MALEGVSPPDLTVGDPYKPQFTFTVNNAAANGSATVKAAIIDFLRTKTYCGPITCTYAAPVGPATNGTWTATFTDTTPLLSAPASLSSKLDAALLKQTDSNTGYAIALLEIQIGAPYDQQTRHFKIKVGKGLVS